MWLVSLFFLKELKKKKLYIYIYIYIYMYWNLFVFFILVYFFTCFVYRIFSLTFLPSFSFSSLFSVRSFPPIFHYMHPPCSGHLYLTSCVCVCVCVCVSQRHRPSCNLNISEKSPFRKHTNKQTKTYASHQARSAWSRLNRFFTAFEKKYIPL